MLVANIKIWKSHLNTREGSDYAIYCDMENPYCDIYCDTPVLLPLVQYYNISQGS